MGNKWEVWAYKTSNSPQAVGGYAYELVWGGASALGCIRAAIKAKRTAGCVKVEWR
jgi:hypothetical protein